MLPCLSKQLLNISCPGCGFQRSLNFVINGEFLKAFYMYPAIYFIILLFVFISINLFFKHKKVQKTINILAIFTITTILINYILIQFTT